MAALSTHMQLSVYASLSLSSSLKPLISKIQRIAFSYRYYLAFFLLEIISQLANKYSLPLKTGYNSTRGFFVQYQPAEGVDSPSELPSEFVKVVKTKNVINFTTSELVSAVG